MDLQEAIMAKKVHPLDTKLFNHRKFKVVKGRFGVEIELEGRRLPQDLPDWAVHNDGSLRDGGIEYVLPTPLNLNALDGAMESLNKHLRQNDADVVLSPRASTHIHVNMQSETLRTIFHFLTLYSIVDPLLCRLAGSNRDGNLFCLPVSDTGNLPDTVARMVAFSLGGLFSNMPQRGKYASLNQNTLLSFGSLECRVFPPTISSKDVVKWAGWLENLLELARETKDDVALRSQIDLARTHPAKIVRQIFGDVDAPMFDAERAIHLGCEIAYEVYRAYRFGQSPEGQLQFLGKVMYQ